MTRLTVFTPTYNRAKLLTRSYEAMKRQTNKNFIWMIIDDGSTDHTKDMAESWAEEEKEFSIVYYHKENGGLHTAYNEAIAHIETELCVCIDSDDYMPDDAVEKILSFWEENGSDEYAGIVGLDYYADGSGIVGGDPLPDLKSVNLIDLMTGKYPIHNGDRTDVVRTELYRQFAPMKVFPGEKNFNPHYMHLQISKTYDFLVLNENLRFVEYQPDGMSNSMLKQYRNSPNSFVEIRKLYLSFSDTDFKFKFRNSIHLVSSCILAGKFAKVLKESPCPAITFFAIPFGAALTVYVLWKTRGVK
ncbi:MAG: glycosyltransferase family 2 protein [Lachnospiraceae bacterium]|nr:glycosyltransferase family 2 protein [Lachnospiraceae bacterium]